MKKLFTLLASALMFFTGCADSSSAPDERSLPQSVTQKTVISSPDESSDSSDKMPDERNDLEAHYRKLAEQYPDKTVLVWAAPSAAHHEDDVNRYLSEHGKEYVICFDKLRAQFDGGRIKTSYFMKLEQELYDGAEFDLIDSGGIYLDLDIVSNTYRECVNKGYFCALDELLSSTEAGRALYSLMPEKYWDTLRVGGGIYGFDGVLSSLPTDTVFLIDKDSMDSLGINTDELGSNYYDILSKLLGYCSGSDRKICAGSLFGASELLIAYCIALRDGKAVNYFETQSAKDTFALIDKCYAKGIFVQASEAENLPEGKLLAKTSRMICGEFGYDGTDHQRTGKPFGKSGAYIKAIENSSALSPASKAIGIYSGSKHKELAFDALATVMSDKELNDLLCYGADCAYEDGYAIPKEYSNVIDFENVLLRTPSKEYDLEDQAEKYRRALENLELKDTLEMQFDLSCVAEQRRTVINVIMSASDEFPSKKYPEAEAFLAELNRQLYSAGLQDIIDEINSQLGSE